MIKKITFVAFLFVSAFTFAQQSPVGHLTIFSEDGDKFSLVLNGELQNDIPQTNLRIEDLNQPYYNAKILFEDKTLMEITKNNLELTDVDGIFSDVTYKIKRDKNNKSKMKLNYFSSIPVSQRRPVPSNVYVVHYGQPNPVPVSSQVTQTTTTIREGAGVSAGVNIGGINMSVSVNDPMGGSVTHTTTTTTHSSSNSNDEYEENPRETGCNSKNPMSTNNFSSALETVKKQSFEETSLKTAKQIASANCLNTDQISQIVKAFNFEASKLDFAKFAYDHCVDQKNYFKLNNSFGFSTSVDELSEYIQSK